MLKTCSTIGSSVEIPERNQSGLEGKMQQRKIKTGNYDE